VNPNQLRDKFFPWEMARLRAGLNCCDQKIAALLMRLWKGTTGFQKTLHSRSLQNSITAQPAIVAAATGLNVIAAQRPRAGIHPTSAFSRRYLCGLGRDAKGIVHSGHILILGFGEYKKNAARAVNNGLREVGEGKAIPSLTYKPWQGV
jgi:hypothetical protein